MPIPQTFDPPAVDERRDVPHEILVTTNNQISTSGLQRFERRFGLTPLASTRVKLLGVEIRRYRLSDSTSVRGSIHMLRGDPNIRSAQPNFLFALQDDTTSGRQALATKSGEPDPPKTVSETETHREGPPVQGADYVRQLALIDALAAAGPVALGTRWPASLRQAVAGAIRHIDKSRGFPKLFLSVRHDGATGGIRPDVQSPHLDLLRRHRPIRLHDADRGRCREGTRGAHDVAMYPREPDHDGADVDRA